MVTLSTLNGTQTTPDHIVNQVRSWMFSAIYNGTFMLPEIIETCIGVPIICTALNRFIKKK